MLPVDRDSLLRHKDVLLGWLRESRPEELERLWQAADSVRKKFVGEEVYLRALVEISNYCVRRCAYCGIRGPNSSLTRYRMTPEEILSIAAKALSAGIGTIVLQSGEDPLLDAQWVADVIKKIKCLGSVAVTLSLGERPDDELLLWRDAGADRYLVKFETSNSTLYHLYHPPHHEGKGRDRLEMLAALRRFDYEVGSGVIIGLPGQRWVDLANDLLLFTELDLDMIGSGPFIRHPNTPLGGSEIVLRDRFLRSALSDAPAGSGSGLTEGKSGSLVRNVPLPANNSLEEKFRGNSDHNSGYQSRELQHEVFQPDGGLGFRQACENDRLWPPHGGEEQVPADELTTLKVIALSRILCPWANIAATTALATLNPAMGSRLGLRRGANIIMPNFTPANYRKLYEIYPGKIGASESPEDTFARVVRVIKAEGRPLGKGPGTSRNFLRRKGLWV